MLVSSDWIARVRRDVTLKPAFLDARLRAENLARDLLDRKAGAFNAVEFARFMDLCNTEIVPPDARSTTLRDHETRTRFRFSFIGQNRLLMLSSLDACNEWVGRLWHAKGDELRVLDAFLRQKDTPGAGTGLATMLMYLRQPEKWNVWLISLGSALGKLLGRPFPTPRTLSSYTAFNDAVNTHLRRPLGLRPQEIDYILFMVEFS